MNKDADFQHNETYAMMNVTTEQFAYLMQSPAVPRSNKRNASLDSSPFTNHLSLPVGTGG
jgi:hypothetical protein